VNGFTVPGLDRRLAAEGVGTFLLMVAIVGSGITMGDATPAGLFHHAVVVGAVLLVLIAPLAPVSGAHFNPAVTLAFLIERDLPKRDALPYVVVHVVMAIAGAVVANLMFGEAAIAPGTGDRGGVAKVMSEGLATFGLVFLILATVRAGRAAHVPYVVGGYITAAIVFTSSASFANPAVTIGRAFTGTWTGIQAMHVPGYLAAQLVGAMLAVWLGRWMFDSARRQATEPISDLQAPAPKEHAT